MNAEKSSVARVRRFIAVAIGSSGMLACLALSPVANAQQYTLTDLGTLGGLESWGTGINANGQVVGYSYVSGTHSHAFLYSNGMMTDLGTLGGFSSDLFSYAYGINDTGQVVGGAEIKSGGANFPFLFSNGVMEDLTVPLTPTEWGTIQSGVAYAINDSGQITGLVGPGGSQLLFTYSDGNLQVIPPVAGAAAFSAGYGINAAGEITGFAAFGGGIYDAIRYTNGTIQDLDDFGVFKQGYSSTGTAINSLGQITGNGVTTPGVYHAFLYTAGTMVDLGTLAGQYGGSGSSSYGAALNSVGQVVGYSGGTGAYHAFLFSNGEMKDLNTLVKSSPLASTVTLTQAMAINDSGWIVADGRLTTSNQTHAFLLTPVGPATLNGSLASSSPVSIDSSGNYVVNLVITNSGDTPATRIELAAASLTISQSGKAVSTATSTPLPAALNGLVPGASVTVALTFPASAGSAGSAAALRWSLTNTAGSASGTLRLELP
jgi:probable HAF family extracellular repeat protein